MNTKNKRKKNPIPQAQKVCDLSTPSARRI
jgi:hypothetical protein